MQGNATTQAFEPRYIRLDANDNVAIVVNDLGLPAKTRFACGLELRNFVPQGHKVALADIPEGAPIRRYNEVIGTAAQRILAGEWVDEARIRMPTPPELDKLELATVIPAPQAPLEGYTFDGFRNRDGSVGTKNVLAISTSVQCVVGTLQFAIKRIKAELLPKYPNVDDVVGLTHNYGCGVAISAPLAIVPIRTLQNLALNPNFGGEVMVVGLGCEKLVPERLLPDGLDGSVVRMQDEAFDGFGAIVEAIMEMADARLAVLNRRRRETCPASDLVIGLQCGGSDAFSGVTANPALGFAADLLVRAGATVMFSEVTEVRDAIHLLTPRAVSQDVADALIADRETADPDRLRRRPARQIFMGLEKNLEIEQGGVEILVLAAQVSEALMDHAFDPQQSGIGWGHAQQAFDHLPRLVVEREGLRQPALPEQLHLALHHQVRDRRGEEAGELRAGDRLGLDLPGLARR